MECTAFIHRLCPSSEIFRGRSQSSAAPFKLRIDRELSVDDHFVCSAKGIVRSGITLNKPGITRPSEGMVDRVSRVKQAGLRKIVVTGTRYLLDDHSQDDVVRV